MLSFSWGLHSVYELPHFMYICEAYRERVPGTRHVSVTVYGDVGCIVYPGWYFSLLLMSEEF